MSDTLPLSIQNNRRMEKWIRFEADRTVRLAVGKVELLPFTPVKPTTWGTIKSLYTNAQ